MLKVYLETTIPSYLTARPSRDLIIAADQEMTREWWELQRNEVELYTSELTISECSRGNEFMAAKRISVLEEIPVLNADDESACIAEGLVKEGIIPGKAVQDAVHIGIATVNDIDILLTWNCTHIANGATIRRVAKYLHTLGYEAPAICTPRFLLGG